MTGPTVEQRRPTSFPELPRDGVRLHADEDDRLDSLDSSGVLDTPPETTYDALTAMAARLCGTPFAVVTLVDGARQWFRSTHGLELEATPRAMSFCSDVVVSGEVLAVPDALEAARYRYNPLVLGELGVRSYLGRWCPTADRATSACAGRVRVPPARARARGERSWRPGETTASGR